MEFGAKSKGLRVAVRNLTCFARKSPAYLGAHRGPRGRAFGLKRETLCVKHETQNVKRETETLGPFQALALDFSVRQNSGMDTCQGALISNRSASILLAMCRRDGALRGAFAAEKARLAPLRPTDCSELE